MLPLLVLLAPVLGAGIDTVSIKGSASTWWMLPVEGTEGGVGYGASTGG